MNSLNNFLPNYLSQLDQLVNQEKLIEPSAILERVTNKKIFDFEGENDVSKFPLKIQKTLVKIAKLGIGQNLLTFLCDACEKPLILKYPVEKSGFSVSKNLMELDQRLFSLWKNPGQNQCGTTPFKISFVHELLHWKHSLENTAKFMDMAYPIQPQDLLNPEMEDAEEQLAICGLDALDQNAEIVLCENHFRYAWNLPLRFTHYGVINPKFVIQQDMPIKPKEFAGLFARYHNKLSPTAYRKKALIVEILHVNSHQQQLMDAIQPFVQVYNLAHISDKEWVETLKTNELWDLDVDSVLI